MLVSRSHQKHAECEAPRPFAKGPGIQDAGLSDSSNFSSWPERPVLWEMCSVAPSCRHLTSADEKMDSCPWGGLLDSINVRGVSVCMGGGAPPLPDTAVVCRAASEIALMGSLVSVESAGRLHSIECRP